MKNLNKPSRRNFIKSTALSSLGVLVASQQSIAAPAILKYWGKPNSNINGVQVGVITYSYRSMPDQSAESVLKYIIDSGISAVELMGNHAEYFAGMPQMDEHSRGNMRTIWQLRRKETLTEDEKNELAELQKIQDQYNKQVAAWRQGASMDKFVQLRKMYKEAGIQIYAFKPRAFEKDNTPAEMDYGFRAAKALGASHVTLEHPSDDAHTALLGKLAAKHKIHVAYHGHLQETPVLWDTAITQSAYNAINLDLGHYIAAGNTDIMDFIPLKHKNISSMHMKDRQTPENGQGNLIWGEGDTPLKEVLTLMKNQKYKFPGTIEVEYKIPEDSDAVKEVGRCLDHCKKLIG